MAYLLSLGRITDGHNNVPSPKVAENLGGGLPEAGGGASNNHHLLVVTEGREVAEGREGDLEVAEIILKSWAEIRVTIKHISVSPRMVCGAPQ